MPFIWKSSRALHAANCAMAQTRFSEDTIWHSTHMLLFRFQVCRRALSSTRVTV